MVYMLLTYDNFVIFKQNGDDSMKHGSSSRWPRKHVEGYTL